MKFIKNKQKLKEYEEYINKLEKDCDIERIERTKLKNECNKIKQEYENLKFKMDKNILKIKKIQEQNKFLKQREKKLQTIEMMLQNRKEIGIKEHKKSLI